MNDRRKKHEGVLERPGPWLGSSRVLKPKQQRDLGTLVQAFHHVAFATPRNTGMDRNNYTTSVVPVTMRHLEKAQDFLKRCLDTVSHNKPGRAQTSVGDVGRWILRIWLRRGRRPPQRFCSHFLAWRFALLRGATRRHRQWTTTSRRHSAT